MAYGLDRFLTTHTGSLPRLIRAMFAKEEGVARNELRQPDPNLGLPHLPCEVSDRCANAD